MLYIYVLCKVFYIGASRLDRARIVGPFLQSCFASSCISLYWIILSNAYNDEHWLECFRRCKIFFNCTVKETKYRKIKVFFEKNILNFGIKKKG